MGGHAGGKRAERGSGASDHGIRRRGRVSGIEVGASRLAIEERTGTSGRSRRASRRCTASARRSPRSCRRRDGPRRPRRRLARLLHPQRHDRRAHPRPLVLNDLAARGVELTDPRCARATRAC
jgi:hypothetical protein